MRNPKTHRPRLIIPGLCALILGFCFSLPTASAASFQEFDQYELHYNAFYSVDIDASVARTHQLKRNPGIGTLNITLLEKTTNEGKIPRRASVKIEAINLVGQIKDIQASPVFEPGAIYYLAQFRFSHGETFRFNVTVIPEGTEQPLRVSFQQRFYQVNP